jgi:hypothetical protein
MNHGAEKCCSQGPVPGVTMKNSMVTGNGVTHAASSGRARASEVRERVGIGEAVIYRREQGFLLVQREPEIGASNIETATLYPLTSRNVASLSESSSFN